MTGRALIRPIPAVAWELRAAWATDNRTAHEHVPNSSSGDAPKRWRPAPKKGSS